jgi:hypothetical protein
LSGTRSQWKLWAKRVRVGDSDNGGMYKIETARAHENHIMSTPGAHHVFLVAVVGTVRVSVKRRQREETAEASGGG